MENTRGDIHDYCCKLDKLKSELASQNKATEDLAEKIFKGEERKLALERYSRDFNPSFYNVPELPDED